MGYKYKRVYLTEKSKQVEALAPVLNAKISGLTAYNSSEGIAIVPLQGHVLINEAASVYAEKYDRFVEESLDKFPKRLNLIPNPELKAKYNNAIEHLKEAEEIVIATDFDNEGAAIAMNIIEKAGADKRVAFMLEMGSTHPKEILHSINNPIDIPFRSMAEAGRLRAWIDFLEGMYLSRALSMYLGNNYAVKLNYGGVKAPLTYIVVERDIAYDNHKVSYFWTVKGKASFRGSVFSVKLKHFTEETDNKGNTKKIWTEHFESEAEAREACKALEGKDLELKSLVRAIKKSTPPKLFELTGLQAEMSKLYKVNPLTSMELAQKNYDNPVSIQAYPRTDTPYLKSSEYEDVEYILQRLGSEGVIDKEVINDIMSRKIPKRNSTFNDKEVTAHGAIIPTKEGDYKKWLSSLPKLNKDMFQLVANRYVMQFMEDYSYENVSGESVVIDNKYKLVFSENRPVNAGWKGLTDKSLFKSIENYKVEIPVDLSKGDFIHIDKLRDIRGETKPKPPFTMETLLIAMDKVASLFPDNPDIKKYLGDSGIGTSATRSKIIMETIDPDKNGGEPWLLEINNKVRSSDKAKNFIKALPVTLVSPIKRAQLSQKLKEVERGNLTYDQLATEYLEETKKNIELVKKIVKEKGFIKGAEKGKLANVEPLGNCPLCEGSIIEKKKIFSCNNAKYVKVEEGIINEGCQYMIVKSSLKKLGKPNITKSEVKKLLKIGKVSVSLKSQKTGKAYNKNMIVDKKWGVKIDFN